MSKKYYGKKYVEAQKKHLVLVRQVLEHLMEHGPTHYDALYVLFDRNGTAHIQTILQELKQWKYIEIGKDTYEKVSITSSGLKRLEPPKKTERASTLTAVNLLPRNSSRVTSEAAGEDPTALSIT